MWVYDFLLKQCNSKNVGSEWVHSDVLCFIFEWSSKVNAVLLRKILSLMAWMSLFANIGCIATLVVYLEETDANGRGIHKFVW